jgi:hypothetical protein
MALESSRERNFKLRERFVSTLWAHLSMFPYIYVLLYKYIASLIQFDS